MSQAICCGPKALGSEEQGFSNDKAAVRLASEKEDASVPEHPGTDDAQRKRQTDRVRRKCTRHGLVDFDYVGELSVDPTAEQIQTPVGQIRGTVGSSSFPWEVGEW